MPLWRLAFQGSFPEESEVEAVNRRLTAFEQDGERESARHATLPFCTLIQIQQPAIEGLEKIHSFAFGLEASHQGMMECTAGEVLASFHAETARAFGLDCGR